MKKTLFGLFCETLKPSSDKSAYSFVAENWSKMDKEELKTIAMEALYQLKGNQEADMLENIEFYHEDMMKEED